MDGEIWKSIMGIGYEVKKKKKKEQKTKQASTQKKSSITLCLRTFSGFIGKKYTLKNRKL